MWSGASPYANELQFNHIGTLFSSLETAEPASESAWTIPACQFVNRETYLEGELHLTRLRAVHLRFLKNLVVLRVRSLTNVLDAPGKTYTRRHIEDNPR